VTASHIAALTLAAFVAGFALASALGVRSLRALRAERDAANAAGCGVKCNERSGKLNKQHKRPKKRGGVKVEPLSEQRLAEINERVIHTSALAIYSAVMASPYKTTMADDYFAEFAVNDVAALLADVKRLRLELQQARNEALDAQAQLERQNFQLEMKMLESLIPPDVESLYRRARVAEVERDTLKWEDDGQCGHCGEDAVRVSIDLAGYPHEVYAVRYCQCCHNAWVREEPVRPDADSL